MRIWKRNDGEHIARFSERYWVKGPQGVDICNNLSYYSIYDYKTGLA